MKTKPITLILTLLFCLSGSVFAEEDKNIRSSELPELTQIKAHYYTLGDNYSNILEIMQSLVEKNKGGIENAKIKSDIDQLISAVTNFSSLLLKVEKIKIIMHYENELMKMDNDEKITSTHNKLKKQVLNDDLGLKGYEFIYKKIRVELNNTAAVLEIKETIKNLKLLINWMEKEAKKILKNNLRTTADI